MPEAIEPHRVTKPIQLLAAWLVGLIATDSTLLTGARVIARPEWASSVLVVAAVAAIPLFLISIFLLQTRFRPEMQEDSYYSEYLKNSMTGMQTSAALDVRSLREQVADSDRAILEMVRAVQSEVAELGISLTTVSDATTPEVALKQQIAEFSASFDEALIRTLAEKVKIEVNDLLPHYDQIRRALEGAGYRITSTFGSTSAYSTKPKIFTLTATHDVPAMVFRRVFALVHPYGLDSVSVTHERAFGTSLYVGGYGYVEDRVAPLTEPLVTAIRDESRDEADLYGLIQQASTLGPLGR